MSHLIELKDIYKIYHMGEETVHALDGINLTVDQGEFVLSRAAAIFRICERPSGGKMNLTPVRESGILNAWILIPDTR